jgi:hypothetical protein
VDNVKQQASVKFVCKHCEKSFSKESTLLVHMCESKRRAQQEKDTGVQLGFRAYLRFYEMTQGSAKTKTYADFSDSAYYSAFVKFGQYLVQIRCVNTGLFTDYLLKESKKLDQWTKDIFYDEWLYTHLRKEHPSDALERSLTELQTAADEAGVQLAESFTKISSNKLCNMIVNGRVSPWVLYNCNSGVNFLASLNTEQVKLVFKWIEPTFWQHKFTDFVADVEFNKSVLATAGL